jgi:uncharacterized membrane protein YkoI
MAVMAKGDMTEYMDDEEEVEEDEMLPKKKRMQDMDMSEMEDDDMDEEESDMPVIGAKKKMGMGAWDEMAPKKKRKAVAVPVMEEDEEDLEESATGKMDEEDYDADAEDQEADRKRRMAGRKRRMASMKVKAADWDDDAYLCGFESKMLAGSANPCAACPGGCAPESDLPTLIEVQGIAEEMIGGKVLDSGYANVNDVFIVDVQRKDGRIAEAIFDGSTAECLSWALLDEDTVGTKSLETGFEMISIDDAVDVAVKSLPGEVVAVDADIFEGHDVYAVEIAGVDGKSYDGFVSLKGELLGYDEYDAEEAASIDEETAEYALKAMYSEDERMDMAKEGMALPDGSFPIKDVDDLKNAIQAYGRAKDKPAARLHIIKRAEALEAYNLIPEAWVKESEGEKSAEDGEFLAALMEFELLAVEEDLD